MALEPHDTEAASRPLPVIVRYPSERRRHVPPPPPRRDRPPAPCGGGLRQVQCLLQPERSALPRTKRALEGRRRLTATIEGYVARHSLGFQEPIDWLIAVFCPAHVPNILAYYEDRGPRLIDVLQSPAKLRRLDVALAGLVEGLAAALAASSLSGAAALEAVLGVLRLDPRPRLRGASPQTGLSPFASTAARRSPHGDG